METFILQNKSKQRAKESLVESETLSKLRQLSLLRGNIGLPSDSHVLTEKKCLGSAMANPKLPLKFGSAGVTVGAKTPKPPTLPRSRSFYNKSGRNLDSRRRTGGDGEACKETMDEEDLDIDYCCIERMPGDGCFSESTEDCDFGNLSDGYYDDEEEEDGLDDLENVIQEDTCEELSQASSSSDSGPTTAESSRAGSAQLSCLLRREKKVRSFSSKRSFSAGVSNTTKAEKKTNSAISRRSGWTTGGTEEIRPALTPSLFPNVPPTIHFTVDGERVHSFPSKTKKLLKWKMSSITPNVVKLCIARTGFRPTKKNDWLGYWGKHMKATAFKSIRDCQKVNHFPGSFQIGRKDKLWKNLAKLQVRHGKKEFGFIPQTFVMPHDFRNFKRVWEDGGNKQKWIVKPPASARGIGIRIIHKWNQIPRKRPAIVQKYLSKPYLINGKKFDLRIYVYISSFDPLRIYVFEEGLARFATCKYSSSSKSLNNKFMHLTNYSINKKNQDAYIPNNDEDACQGHKWSLKALWGYLKRIGVNTTRIWDSIKDIIIKTIISCESTVNLLMKQNVRNSYSCNELFGFDIMLDENVKPWILEVNISPSLHSTSPLDLSIKGQMVRDLLNLSGYRLPEGMGSTITSFAMDRGKVTLNSNQKAKHGFYVNNHNEEIVKATILDILTPEDVRVLIETEDEYSRRGCFQRIFPSESSQKYLKYFDSPRYLNILLDEWTKKYLREGNRRALGIALLCTYALEGIHLDPVSNDLTHQWVSPQYVPSSQAAASSTVSRSFSAPAASRWSDEKLSSSSQVSLPKIKRKVVRYRLSTKPLASSMTLPTKNKPSAVKQSMKNACP